MGDASSVRAILALALLQVSVGLGACDVSDPCDSDQRFSAGNCVPVPSAGDDAGARSDAGAARDAAMSATDAAAEPDAGACADDPEPSLGASCQDDADCSCRASYCARMPGAEAGFCTVSPCETDPDDCPEGYACFDLSSVGVAGVPTFCRAL